MDFDVLIVGMGPVGAVAANLAGMWGLKTLAVDKLPGVFEKPRAIAFDHEIMRVFGNLGIADRIADHVMPYRVTEYHTSGSRLIKRIAPAAAPYLLGWAPNYVFTQPPVENALREKIRSLPNVTVELETEVESLTPLDDGLAVYLVGKDGIERRVNARYVLACDGGTSSVRMGLGLEMENLQFDEPWVVVDVMVNPEAIDRLPSTNIQYCETDRPCTYIVGPGRHRRWEFMINPDESPAEISQPEAVASLISRWLPPHEYEFWRASSYRFHALILKTWRQGNLFFLGDAAHMTPPFMAQGMCQGVRDASNLIWKLALVHRGLASSTLLDTYQKERIPHVRQTTLVAKQFGQVICERDPVKAAARDDRMIEELEKMKGPTIRQSLIPGLSTGFLAPTGQTAVCGAIFPQPFVENFQGQSGWLDDFTGAGFRLVVAPGTDIATLIAELDTWKKDRDFPFELVQLVNDWKKNPRDKHHYREKYGVLQKWMAEHKCSAIIVRPDHYVFGAAASEKDGVKLLKALRQALSARPATNIDFPDVADMA